VVALLEEDLLASRRARELKAREEAPGGEAGEDTTSTPHAGGGEGGGVLGSCSRESAETPTERTSVSVLRPFRHIDTDPGEEKAHLLFPRPLPTPTSKVHSFRPALRHRRHHHKGILQEGRDRTERGG